MELWEVDVKCPFCDSSFRGNRWQGHRNKHHANIATTAFEKAVVGKIAADASALNTKRTVQTAAQNTATKALMRASKQGGFSGLVSGGAIGQGKRR